MKLTSKRLNLLAGIVLLVLVTACTLPGTGENNLDPNFPTPFSFFDTLSPPESATPTVTPTRTSFPSPTDVHDFVATLIRVHTGTRSRSAATTGSEKRSGSETYKVGNCTPDMASI